jgi:hypothetical protein
VQNLDFFFYRLNDKKAKYSSYSDYNDIFWDVTTCSLVEKHDKFGGISLFHRAFQFTMCNDPTNAFVCNKTLIQMSHIKTLKITPTCFDHQGDF